MADAHADAVARAKAIAARLAGTSATAAIPGAPVAAPPPVSSESQDVNAMLDAALNGGSSAATVGGSGSKRGVEDALASLIPGLGHVSDPSKRARTDGSGGGGGMYEATKKIWIPTDKNPGYNYVGLLIGPGGSKQRELVSSSGGNVKISIRGKGSKGSEVVPGQPEEPLHVLLEGKQENVNNAEKLVRELLEDSEAADKEKARQLGSMNPTDDRMLLVVQVELEVHIRQNQYHKYWVACPARRPYRHTDREWARHKSRKRLAYPTVSLGSSLAVAGRALPVCNVGRDVVSKFKRNTKWHRVRHSVSLH